MTPFAMLDQRTKSAGAFPFAPTYLPGRVPESAAPQTQPAPIKHPGVIEDEWGDLAASSVPVVGSLYQANKAIGDFRNGNIGSGIGNLLWAGASLIPGVGLLRGGMGAARAGMKGMSALSKLKQVGGGAWKGMRAAAPSVKSTVGVLGAGMAAPALLDPAAPTSQPSSYAPPAPQDYVSQATERIRNMGLS